MKFRHIERNLKCMVFNNHIQQAEPPDTVHSIIEWNNMSSQFLYIPMAWKQWLLPTKVVQFVYWRHNGRADPCISVVCMGWVEQMHSRWRSSPADGWMYMDTICKPITRLDLAEIMTITHNIAVECGKKYGIAPPPRT